MAQTLQFRDEGDTEYEDVNAQHPLPVAPVPLPPFNVTTVNAANTANLTSVYVGPCQVLGWAAYNHAATERLVRIYDKASAPVVATDAGLIKLRIGLPATATGAGSNFTLGETGLRLTSGLAFAIVTGITSDVDGTAPTAGDVLLNIFWRPA